jgi:hypothetical protein
MDNKLIILLTDLEYTLSQIKYKKVDVKKMEEQLAVNDNIDKFISNYYNNYAFYEMDEPNITNIIYYLNEIGDDYKIDYYVELFKPLTDETKKLFLERLKLLVYELKDKYDNVN